MVLFDLSKCRYADPGAEIELLRDGPKREEGRKIAVEYLSQYLSL